MIWATVRTMSFLRIDGWPIEVEALGGSGDLATFDVTRRSENQRSHSRRRRTVSGWSFRTGLLGPDEANAVEALVAGLGHTFPFDTATGLFSTRGLPPASVGGGSAIAAGGRFGEKLTVVGTCSWDFARSIIPIDYRWTVLLWRSEAGTWRHYAIRDDGAVWRDGARNDALAVGAWFSFRGGTLTLQAGDYDDMQVVGASLPAAAIVAMQVVGAEGTPAASTSAIYVDGDAFGARSLVAIGEVGQQSITASGSSRYPDPAGVGARTNMRRVTFTLQPSTTEPAIAVARPVLFAGFDTAEGGAAAPTNLGSTGTLTANGAPATVTGQVGQAARLVASTSWYGYSGGAFGLSSSFAGALWLRQDAAPGIGSVMSLLSKVATGNAGWAFELIGSSSGKYRLQVRLVDAFGVGRFVQSVEEIVATSWRHLAFAYDGSNTIAGIHLYADGARLTKTTVSDVSPVGIGNALAAAIGRRHGAAGATDALSGDVDEVGLWASQLRLPQVQELYRMGRRRETARYFGA